MNKTIIITNVRFKDDTHKTLDSVAAYKWVDTKTGESVAAERAVTANWMKKNDVRAFIETGYGAGSRVEVIPASSYGEAYLSTVRDGTKSDKLLSLPTF